MIRRKMRLIAMAGLVLMLTFVLAGGAVAAKPEPAGGLGWRGIVAFDDAVVVNEAAEEAIIHGAGGVIKMNLEALGMAIVLLPDTEAARAIAREQGVLWVEEDSYRYYHLEPLPWGINRIDAEWVWDDVDGNTGDGVNVAVLDTGIDTDHSDLSAEGGYSCVNRDTSNVEDKNGHGTHCSGIIAALDNEIGVVGVGPDIDLYAVQISRGTRIRLSDIIEGIEWCIGTLDGPNPIQVMSMSFGGGYSQSENDALQTAYDAGIVLVSSAGNQSGGAVTYPAALDQVIAVSAVDKDDQIASFSSIGLEVELAAPGVSIYSTYKDGSYETLSGTSMAAPHVTGVAALILASPESAVRDANNDGIPETNADGIWTVEEVHDLLCASAEDLGTTGKDNLYGYGLVDAENAVLGTTDGDDLAPPATGAIDGTVTVDGTDPPQPIAGATVTADGYTTTTGVDGTYTLADLPVGSYTVTASATGYTEQSKPAEVLENETTFVDFALSLTTTPTGTMSVDSITFSVKKAGPNLFLYTTVKVVLEDGSAVDGAGVEMTLTHEPGSWNFAGNTGSDGTVKFTLMKAPSGGYTAEVTRVWHTDYDWDGVKVIASCTLNADGTVT